MHAHARIHTLHTHTHTTHAKDACTQAEAHTHRLTSAGTATGPASSELPADSTRENACSSPKSILRVFACVFACLYVVVSACFGFVSRLSLKQTNKHACAHTCWHCQKAATLNCSFEIYACVPADVCAHACVCARAAVACSHKSRRS